jgi:hypothetical protein
MITIDRTTKLFLTVIVLLLAAIVFRPMLPISPSAMAQTTTTTDTSTVEVTQIPQPSLIAVPSGQYVREIQVIDSAKAFLVRYDNRIEVYHVQVLQLTRAQYQQYLQQK